MLRYIASLSVFGASVAAGGPLEKNLIPADAVAVIHFDMEAFGSSAVGRYALEHRAHFDKLDEVGEDLGLDLLKDLYDVTVCLGEKGGEVLIIAHVTAAADGIVTALREHAETVELETIVVNSHEAHAFRADGERGYFRVAPLDGDRRLLIIADDLDRFTAALALAEGSGQSMAAEGTMLDSIEPTPGAFFMAITNDLQCLSGSGAAHSNFLKHSKAIHAEAGEHGGEAFARVSLTARAPEDAETLKALGQGVLAMGRIVAAQESDQPEAVRQSRLELLKAVAFDSKDDRVVVSLSLPTGRLVELLEAAR